MIPVDNFVYIFEATRGKDAIRGWPVLLCADERLLNSLISGSIEEALASP
jgi:hypothetical protein